MFHWKNNGPGPPFSNEEIVLILAGLVDITAISCFVRWALVSAYQSWIVWKHFIR